MDSLHRRVRNRAIPCLVDAAIVRSVKCPSGERTLAMLTRCRHECRHGTRGRVRHVSLSAAYFFSAMQYSVFLPRRYISPSATAGVATKNSSASTSNFSPLFTTTTSPSSDAMYSFL